MHTQTIHVYLPEGYADWEVGLALAHLNRHEAQFMPTPFAVRTVGETRAPVRTMAGMTLMPDLALEDVSPDSSAMWMLPGGTSWDAGRNVAAAELARAFVDAGAPVAAICGATAGMARAGLLDARAHTSNARDYLAATGYAGGARYVDAPAVTDGGVITASSLAPVDFAKAVFEALGVFEGPLLDAWHGLFSTGEPRYFFELQTALG